MTRRALLHDMALDAWEASLFALVVFAVFEAIEPGFVARVFDPNLLLGFAASAAGLALAAGPARSEDRKPRARRSLLAIAFLAPLAAWYLSGDLAVKWRAAAAAAIALLSAVLWNAFKKDES